jgi:hypothetical protein
MPWLPGGAQDWWGVILESLFNQMIFSHIQLQVLSADFFSQTIV